MADILVIPIDAVSSSFKIRCELSKKEFVLKFDFNTREARWMISLFDGNENTLVEGVALVANYPLFSIFKGIQYPSGRLMLFDTTGKYSETDRDSLGNTHYLLYEAN